MKKVDISFGGGNDDSESEDNLDDKWTPDSEQGQREGVQG